MLKFGVRTDRRRETDASPNAAGGWRQAAPGTQPGHVSRLVAGSASQPYVIYSCRDITEPPPNTMRLPAGAAAGKVRAMLSTATLTVRRI